MKYVWDIKRNKPLWIVDGIAEDGVTGELFAVAEGGSVLEHPSSGHEMFIPIMKSSYHLIVDGINKFYESNMKETKLIEEVNVELVKYGM